MAAMDAPAGPAHGDGPCISRDTAATTTGAACRTHWRRKHVSLDLQQYPRDAS